jgi:O-antigen/teichoic acid export membrane protein
MLAGRTLTYALGGLAYKGIALVTVPILARLLAPDELGLLDAAAVMATIIAILAGMGTEQAVAWLQPRIEDEHQLWGAAVGVVAICALVLIAVVAFAREPIAALLTGNQDHSAVFVAAAAYGAVMAFTAIGLNAVRLRATPRHYAVASFLVVAGEMSVGLLIAWRLTTPVFAMLLGWAAASAMVTVAIFRLHVPRIARPSAAIVDRLVRFGAPLVPAAIAWVVGDVAIRSAIARGTDLGVLGQYGIAFRIATVLAILVTGFAVAWQPYLYRSTAAEVLPRARRAAPVLIAVLGAIAIGLTLLAQEIVELVAGTQYMGAVSAVPGLAGSMVALGLFQLTATLSGAKAGTRAVAVAALIGALVQVVAAFVLVARLGITGAALASLLGYLVAAASLTWATRLVSHVAGGSLFVAAAFIVAAGLGLASWLMWSPLGIRLGVAFITAIVGGVALLWMHSRGGSVTA